MWTHKFKFNTNYYLPIIIFNLFVVLYIYFVYVSKNVQPFWFTSLKINLCKSSSGYVNQCLLASYYGAYSDFNRDKH